jgi:hypothetical protein
MGGYVSLVASETVNAKAVFLMAPALYMPGYERREYPSRCSHIEIVHGRSDDVIPPEHSIRYAKEADCALHLIRGDHALNGSLEVVAGFRGVFEAGHSLNGCRVRQFRQIRDLGVSLHNQEISPKQTLANTSSVSIFGQ